MKKTDQIINVSSISTELLGEGKSTRLLQMRQKAKGEFEEKQIVTEPDVKGIQDIAVATELIKIRKMIDQRLHDILSVLPPDKRQRFFMIRFGMTPQQLKQLPIEEILQVLRLKQNLSAGMKRIANLDYNGRPISKGAD